MHASIASYYILISFMMKNKYQYVRGKIFDGGNKISTIKIQHIKVKNQLILYINNINETCFMCINFTFTYELAMKLSEKKT